MDAVLPLTLRDLARSALLFESLERHVRGLDELLVVLPASDVSRFRSPSRLRVRAVSELEIVPELALFPAVDGWYRQQLVKLGAADWVRSDFYLTLDADVIATRTASLEGFCGAGRAPCYVDYADLHPKWYAAATELLGLPLPRAGISHNVTPAILHRAAVRSLTQHLTRRWQRREFSPGLRGLKQRAASAWAAMSPQVRGWAALLASSSPWSEYSLYYSFLEATGQFDDYHYESHRALYDPQRSLWHAEHFDGWNPEPAFLGNAPPFFIVVQSNTGIELARLRARLEARHRPPLSAAGPQDQARREFGELLR